MATTKSVTPLAAWMKSDDSHDDTSKASWMAVAREELGKRIEKLGSPFVDALRASLAVDAPWNTTEKRLQAFERTVQRLRFGGE
jgi:hypothetical protein